MSGGDDPIYARPAFGRSLDEWRVCTAPGCDWRVLHSLLCKEHGGMSPYIEWRCSVTGVYEDRPGYTGPVISPLRAR